MKPHCEKCNKELPMDGIAYICSYECTFCGDCTNEMQSTCPNCGGELIRRPKRGTQSIRRKSFNKRTRYFAESTNYKVTAEDETVTLWFKDESRPCVDIGDFIGNPDCAIISTDEKYIVIGGYGLIIYKLQEPFEEYHYDKQTDQYKEIFRDVKSPWYVDCLYYDKLDGVDIGPQFFRFIVSNSKGEFLYRMNYLNNDFEIIPLNNE